MNHIYSLLALDIANDRVEEAREAHRAALIQSGAPERPGFARRTLAHGFAAVSRGSAAVVRRLDNVVAEDLGRSLSAAK